MDKQVYIGLDVSLAETSICVVDCDGKIVFETKAESDPTSLHCALKGYVERAERIGIEASSVGVWLARELLFRQLPVILVEARHMRTSLSAMRNKTDKNDARGIAQMMRMGWYRAVHVKGVENQRLRTMLANRKLLKRKLVDLENHIRGSLRVHGLKVGSVGRREFEARVRELLEGADFVFERMIDAMLTVRNAVLEGYDRLHTMLRCVRPGLPTFHGRARCRPGRRIDLQGCDRRSASFQPFPHRWGSSWTDAKTVSIRQFYRLCRTNNEAGRHDCSRGIM